MLPLRCLEILASNQFFIVYIVYYLCFRTSSVFTHISCCDASLYAGHKLDDVNLCSSLLSLIFSTSFTAFKDELTIVDLMKEIMYDAMCGKITSRVDWVRSSPSNVQPGSAYACHVC